ncbi:MAG: hypothetical protein WCO04_09990 [Pseudomonadota bacterium]
MYCVTDRAFVFIVNPALCLHYPLEVLRTARARRRYRDLACPSHQSKKLLSRKLFNHDPLFPVLADKLCVRDHFRARCPDRPSPEVL